MAEEQVALMPQAELDEGMLAAMRAKTGARLRIDSARRPRVGSEHVHSAALRIDQDVSEAAAADGNCGGRGRRRRCGGSGSRRGR